MKKTLREKMPNLNLNYFEGYEREVLYSSLAIFDIDFNALDFSMFVIPSFRVLELLLQRGLIELGYKPRNHFYQFHKSNGYYLLDNFPYKEDGEVKYKKSPTTKLATWVETAYNYYATQRHKACHLNVNQENRETMSKVDAIHTVEKVYQLIDNYFLIGG